jgi:hypothetical protein
MIVSDDMRSEMEAMRQRLEEQGERLNKVEYKLEQLRDEMMRQFGRGKY